jgi:hypothetical protein
VTGSNALSGSNGQQHGVTIRRGLGDRVGAEIAAGAGAVLDQHRLADPFGQLVGEDPSHRIDAAARRERHHDADVARWIALAKGIARKAKSDEPHVERPDQPRHWCHSLDLQIPG